MTAYTATAAREGRWWVIEVDGVGVTQSRTLAEARIWAQGLVEAVTGEADADVTVTPTLPDGTMRQMAAAWPEGAIGQQAVGQLPWGHVTVLLGKLDEPDARDWYARAAVAGGWSRNVLLNQMAGGVRSPFRRTLTSQLSSSSQSVVPWSCPGLLSPHEPGARARLNACR